MFGLKKKDIDDIVLILNNFHEVKQAFIFGSRAKGNYRIGSDVDIVIKGEGANYDIALKIANLLNEDTLMPYHFDVLSYEAINDKNLTAHIDRMGKLLYQAKNISVVNEPLVEYKKDLKKKDS